jgi:purine-binding chemotaxis protein CheW
VAIIRGVAVPVVDAGALMGGAPVSASRWVSLRVAERGVALAVESVEGVRALSRATFEALPPLLADAGTDVVAAIGTLDAELLVVLQLSRLLPESAWSLLEPEGGHR